jgi:predicted nucleic acid-binding protein
MAFIYADSCMVIYLIEGDFSRRKQIAEYILKTPDAIHLAAALVSGCDVFLTNDLRLNRVDVELSVEVLPF